MRFRSKAALIVSGLLVSMACAVTAVQADLRRSSGLIVYGLHAPGRKDGFFRIAPDGSGTQRLPIATAECTDCLVLSPDGKRLLFVALTADKRVGGATANVDGTNRRVFRLPDATLNLEPTAWSPDEKRVAFEGWDRSGGRNGLYTGSSTDANGLVRVTTSRHGSHDVPLAYAPDGTRILLLRTGPSGDIDQAGSLYVVRADGGHLVKLNPSGTSVGAPFGSPASWSPSGRTIAFAAGSGGRSAVFTIDTQGRHLHRITPWGRYTTSARWSPDGNWIAFDKLNRLLPAHDLFIIRPDGTSVKDILVPTPGPGSCCAVWSPDSRYLLFQRGDQRLWTMAIDGSSLKRLTTTAGEYLGYAWGPSR
jgi:TolB protein